MEHPLELFLPNEETITRLRTTIERLGESKRSVRGNPSEPQRHASLKSMIARASGTSSD
jgi:hypothetical protein